MSVLVMGVSHRTAPLDLLERLAVADDDLAKRLDDLVGCQHVSEAVLLSTCNRTEAYVVAERFHAAYGEVRDVLARIAHVDPPALTDHVYAHYEDDAARHLFAVAAGLRSAVLGESEIMGQVRSAWHAARSENAAGSALDQLFAHAAKAAKRIRSETGIARGTASVSHAAVEMATRHLGTLHSKRVLVVGAGEMAEGMVVALAAAGPQAVEVVNRTPERAQALASRIDGRSLPLERLEEALAQTDVLLTSTGATSVIVDHARVGKVLERRAGRPLLIVDIAVPRDVDPAVADLDGVTLLDMDDLSDFAQAGRRRRRDEVADATVILDEEMARFARSRSTRELAPLIEALHARAEAIRLAETERLLRLLPDATPAQLASIDRATKAIANKLLHRPTAALKDAAGKAKGDRLADSLRDLFDL